MNTKLTIASASKTLSSLLLFTIIGASLQAFASALPHATMEMNASSSSDPAPNPQPIPMPHSPRLRDIKIRASVSKQVITRTQNGVRIDSEKVCTVEFVTALYDQRESGSISVGEGANCDSKLKDKAVRVNVNGFMSLSQVSIGGEALRDVKSANLFLVTRANTTPGQNDSILPSQSAYAATLDLDTKSLFVTAWHSMWAGEGDYTNDEEFAVTAEFVDELK